MNTNFVNAAFHRGRARAERSNPTGTGRPPRSMRYVAARAEPGQRGYLDGKAVIIDEAAFYADPRQIFTELDKCVKRFTIGDAYAQAAMVIRTRRGLSPDTPVFPKGSYDSRDKSLILTLAELNDKVEELIFNR